MRAGSQVRRNSKSRRYWPRLLWRNVAFGSAASFLPSSGHPCLSPDGFATLFELTRYFRSLATFVTPDPNIMLRAARLRDIKWQRPQKPMSLGDAIQIASALWVREALGVPDLEFLLIDERRTDEARGGLCHSTVRLQDYADNAHTNSDAKAAARLKRVQPALPAQ